MLKVIEKAFLEGYATGDLDIMTMMICVGFTALISLYICLVYRLTNKNSFYDRSFHLSLFGLSVITSAIILTIQSNIVVSLGMVGALSIVRFRTAIKNPMDLVFLFWSISIGIICGAGFAMISVIASVVMTIGIIVFGVLPGEKESLVLVVNAAGNVEKEVMELVAQHCRTWKVRSRTITRGSMSMAVEVRTDHPNTLVEDISLYDLITSVSLVEHDGDVTA